MQMDLNSTPRMPHWLGRGRRTIGGGFYGDVAVPPCGLGKTLNRVACFFQLAITVKIRPLPVFNSEVRLRQQGGLS